MIVSGPTKKKHQVRLPAEEKQTKDSLSCDHISNKGPESSAHQNQPGREAEPLHAAVRIKATESDLQCGSEPDPESPPLPPQGALLKAANVSQVAKSRFAKCLESVT